MLLGPHPPAPFSPSGAKGIAFYKATPCTLLENECSIRLSREHFPTLTCRRESVDSRGYAARRRQGGFPAGFAPDLSKTSLVWVRGFASSTSNCGNQDDQAERLCEERAPRATSCRRPVLMTTMKRSWELATPEAFRFLFASKGTTNREKEGIRIYINSAISLITLQANAVLAPETS
jgi:hypothetical protein